MTQVADSLDRYLEELEGADAAWRARLPASLTDARRHARDRFQALGWPTTEDEEWRLTSVAPIAETKFALATDGRASLGRAELTPFRLPDVAASELVFVNGRFAPELSRTEALPRGVRVQNLASTLRADPEEVETHLTRVAPFERQSFTALNTALFVDGAFLYIPPGDVIESPIHVLFVSTDEGRPTMAHPRVLAVVGNNAHVSIVETYAGPPGSRYFSNAVTEVVVGENASVDHYKLQRESLLAYHVATMHVVQKRNARFQSHSLSFGGALVRNDVSAVLDGEGIECTLNGLYLGDDRRMVDNHTTIDHAKPHCGSREVYKGILADHARAVFNGKIIVRPDAQKTDAKQTNKALLLSEDAQINTKPQLEIFANDVKCTHGAAVGQMDDEAIFYLRARGLGLDEARDLLVHAFAGDVLNRMPLEALRSRADALLLEQLPRALRIPS
jgi:Fe-S cluster assembly protein SufD